MGGGAKAPHRKHTGENASVRVAPPARVTIPLTMHIGAPAECCVEKGDEVFVGTPIAKASGFVSVDTHSSVSGKVVDIADILFTDGGTRPAAVIESDGEMKADPAIAPPVIESRDDLVKAVQKSGLVGLGGAGFPTHVKLSPVEKHLDTLLINGAECEPYITSDFRTMMEDADDLVNGVKQALKWLELPKAVIAIEKNKPEAIELLTEKTKDDDRIDIFPLKTQYPQGAEKVLIGTVTKRAVPAGGLPADAGVVILNVATVTFLSKFLKTGMPLVEKRITIDGGAQKKSGNYIVPIGTNIAELLGDLDENCARILLGGPMMGVALYTPEFPVLKNTNAVLALLPKETATVPNDNCIRCARCAEGCPVRLSPVEIDGAYQRKDTELLHKLSVENCMECGCCSFNCPAGRPLTQTMRLGKAEIRKAGVKK